jgi:phage-related minor tail protein
MALGDVIGTARIGIEPDMSPFKKAAAGFAAAGAVAGAAIVAGIAEAMDQANLTSTLQAQLGTTNAVAAKQGKAAGELYASGVTDSFQDSANAIKAVMQAGLAPPEATNAQLKSIATQAQDVARVFGQDIGDVTSQVSQLIKNKLAVNSSQAFNIITKGFQMGLDKAQDFLPVIEEYGPQFRKAGIEGKQMLGILDQGLKAGARDADIVADAVKEFSIRAIDGTTLTAQGFNDLGLSGVKMAKDFAKGGATANAVLDITLDRLRNVEDPVKRSRIAVSLFGTQAEDLGQALFAIDPSEAAKRVTNFGGATARMGAALRSGPAHEIEVFQRQLKQAFVEVLGNQVLPVLATAAHWVNANLLPPLQALARALAGSLVPAMKNTIAVITSIVNWFKMMATWLIPIGILITGLTLSMTLNAIAAGAEAAAILAVTIAMRIARGITLAMAAAQWLFNAALNANPLVLIVTLIVAFVAAIIVAYHRSETFRAIVQAMWEGIKTAASVAWAYLKPIFDGIWQAMKFVGSVATWLWKNVLAPAFQGIWYAARLMFTILVTAILVPLVFQFKILAAIATWLWRTILAPAFHGIAAVVMLAYSTVIKPTINNMMTGFRAAGAAASWLWRNAIVPAWNGIKAAIALAWAGIKVVLNAFRTYVIGPLVVAFRTAQAGIATAWNAVKSLIAIVWSTTLRPVFNKLRDMLNLVKIAFQTAVTGIKIAWDKISGIARKPVAFVVNTVYNKGIVPVWNAVAKITDVGKLHPVKFAGGGRTRGGIAGVDSIPILAMADEFMVNRKAARSVGYGALSYINRTGKLPGMAWGGKVQGYEDGGIIGWFKSAGQKIGGWAGDAMDIFSDPGKVFTKMLGPTRRLIDKIGGGEWARMLRNLPLRFISGLKDKIVKAVTSVGGLFGGGGGGGKASGSAQHIAQAMLGAYGWGASQFGPLKQLWNGESGWRWNALNASSGAYGIPQALPASKMASAGADWRTNPATQIRWGLGYIKSRYGSPAGAWNFWNRQSPHWYDNGGWLPKGLSLAYNGTGRPERIRNQQQEAALGTGTINLTIENRGVIGSRQEAMDFLVDALETLRRTGRLQQVLSGG